VLAGYVTRICEIYIDDVLLFGTTDNEYLGNTRKVLGRLREKKVTVNPDKTRLGLIVVNPRTSHLQLSPCCTTLPFKLKPIKIFATHHFTAVCASLSQILPV
jgi:hypothetical protein